MNRLIKVLSAKMQALLVCERGAVAMIFGFVGILLVVVVGMGIDFWRAYAVKGQLQAGLDAAALAVGSSPSTHTQAQLEARAAAFFTKNYQGTAFGGHTPTPTVIPADNNSTFNVTATASMPTTFMRIMSVNNLSISATAQVKRATSKLHVALALDNTLSMNDFLNSSTKKIDGLKTATHNLLNQLKGAIEQEGDVLVSIVPFEQTVNVGSSSVNASWLDWTNNSSTTCIGRGDNRTCTTTANKGSWNGCVMDRTQNYDSMNTVPTSGNTLFPTTSGSCASSLIKLTSNWTTLHNKVTAMVPTGWTNQTIGLAWAWMTLTPTTPLSPPAPEEGREQIIIMLTDGKNTKNRWNECSPTATSCTSIDTRTSLICNNIKAAGITIYTVMLGDGNQTLLSGCASDSTKFFNLTSSDQLVGAFNQIGTELTKLRLTR